MKPCSQCGKANAEDALFCIQCGTPMVQAPQGAAGSPPAEGTCNAKPGDSITNADTSARSGLGYTDADNPNTVWLILNIVATLLCCFVPGSIAGIVFAAMGSASFKKGDYEKSFKRAKIAKILFIVSIVAAWIFIIIALLSGRLTTYIANRL